MFLYDDHFTYNMYDWSDSQDKLVNHISPCMYNMDDLYKIYVDLIDDDCADFTNEKPGVCIDFRKNNICDTVHVARAVTIELADKILEVVAKVIAYSEKNILTISEIMMQAIKVLDLRRGDNNGFDVYYFEKGDPIYDPDCKHEYVTLDDDDDEPLQF